MKDIALDSSGDMIYNPVDGSIAMIEGDDQLRQKIKLSLATNLGELEWNNDFGLSHAELMDNSWDKSYLQSLIDDYLGETFEEVNDTTITNYVYNKENRTLDLYLTVELSSGDTLTMVSSLGGEDDDNSGLGL